MQDPEGKEGLVSLMSGLLYEGAGDLDSEAFQQRFYATGAVVNFHAGDDFVAGTLRGLSTELDEPVELLSLALSAPRFDEEPLQRDASLTIAGIRDSQSDPDSRGHKALAKALYGDHPLGRESTEQSVSAITRADLVAMHGKLFARSNLIVGVAGGISPEKLGTVLDELFGDLPEKDGVTPVDPPVVSFGKKIFEPYERPQSSLTYIYPGVAAESPDIYAALLAAEILGGGSITSRLNTELREKRGLTYGAYSVLDPEQGWGSLVISTSTKAEHTGEALRLINEAARNMAEKGPSEQELESARKFLVGSYALRNLGSTTSIADTLVGLQHLDLGRDYPQRQAEHYRSITIEDVQAVAKRLFSVDPTVLIVGPKSG